MTKQRAARSKMEGRGGRGFTFFFLAVCPLLRFKSRLRRRHSGLPRAGGVFFLPLVLSVFLLARRCFFFFALRSGMDFCDGMGFIMGWAQNGGRGRQFFNNCASSRPIRWSPGRGVVPFAHCALRRHCPPCCLLVLAVPSGRVVRGGTSSGTWAVRYLYFIHTSTSMFLAIWGPGRKDKTIVTHRGSTNRV